MKAFQLSKRTNIIICAAMLVFMGVYVCISCVPKLGTAKAYSFGLALSIIVIIGSIVAFWLYSNRRIGLHWTYAIIAISFGLFFMYMIPVYTVPDEVTHINKAYEISNVLLGIEDDPSDGLVMRREDAEYNKNNFSLPIEETDYKFEDAFKMAHDTELVDTEYKPFDDAAYQYFVPAIGITLGRLAGFGTMAMLLLGRLFNLLMFVGIVTLAIYIIPKHKLILLTVGLLPMTIQQGMSFSYDAFVNAMAFLIFALIVKYTCKEDNINTLEIIILGIATLAFLPSKHFAYFSLALLPLVLIFKDKLNKRNKIFVLVIVAICLAVFAWDKMAPTSVVSTSDTNVNIVGWAGEEGYTLSFLLHNPKRILLVIYHTFKTFFVYYIGTMIGDHLGWLEIKTPVIALILLAFVLVMNLFKLEEESESDFTRRNKIYIAILVLVAVACIFAGLLLSWTPLSSYAVLGVQGRYFLPLLPFALAVLKIKRIRLGAWAPQMMLLIILVANFITAQNLIIRLG